MCTNLAILGASNCTIGIRIFQNPSVSSGSMRASPGVLHHEVQVLQRGLGRRNTRDLQRGRHGALLRDLRTT